MCCNDNGNDSGKGSMTIGCDKFLQIIAKLCHEVKASIIIRCHVKYQHMNLKLESDTNACLDKHS